MLSPQIATILPPTSGLLVVSRFHAGIAGDAAPFFGGFGKRTSPKSQFTAQSWPPDTKKQASEAAAMAVMLSAEMVASRGPFFPAAAAAAFDPAAGAPAAESEAGHEDRKKQRDDGRGDAEAGHTQAQPDHFIEQAAES